MKELMCHFVKDIAFDVYKNQYEKMDKKDKKFILKSLCYLDTLISLYRMPPAFEFVLGELTQRFRGIKEEPLEMILNKFGSITLID